MGHLLCVAYVNSDRALVTVLGNLFCFIFSFWDAHVRCVCRWQQLFLVCMRLKLKLSEQLCVGFGRLIADLLSGMYIINIYALLNEIREHIEFTVIR